MRLLKPRIRLDFFGASATSVAQILSAHSGFIRIGRPNNYGMGNGDPQGPSKHEGHLSFHYTSTAMADSLVIYW